MAVVPLHIPVLEELLVDGGEERQGNPVEVLQPQGRAEGGLLAWEHPFQDRLHQDSQTSVVSLSYRLKFSVIKWAKLKVVLSVTRKESTKQRSQLRTPETTVFFKTRSGEIMELLMFVTYTRLG